MSKTKLDRKQAAASAATKVKKKTQAESNKGKKKKVGSNKDPFKLKISTSKISKKKVNSKQMASKVKKKTKVVGTSERKKKPGSNNEPLKLKFSKGKLKMLKQTKGSLKNSSQGKKDVGKKSVRNPPLKLKVTKTMNKGTVSEVFDESLYTIDTDLDSHGAVNNSTDDVYIVDTDYEASDDDWESEADEPDPLTNTTVVQTPAVTCVERITASQTLSCGGETLLSKPCNRVYDRKSNAKNIISNKSQAQNKKVLVNKVDKYKVRNHLNRKSLSLVNFKADPPTCDSRTPVLVVEERPFNCEICGEKFLLEEKYKFHLHKHFDSFEEFTVFINKKQKDPDLDNQSSNDTYKAIEEIENIDNSQSNQKDVFNGKNNEKEFSNQQIDVIEPETNISCSEEWAERRRLCPPKEKELSSENLPSRKKSDSLIFKKSLKVILRRTKIMEEASKDIQVTKNLCSKLDQDLTVQEQSKDEGIETDLSYETIPKEKDVLAKSDKNNSRVKIKMVCKGEQKKVDVRSKDKLTKNNNTGDEGDHVTKDQNNTNIETHVDSGNQVIDKHVVRDKVTVNGKHKHSAVKNSDNVKGKAANKDITSYVENAKVQMDNNLSQPQEGSNEDVRLIELNTGKNKVFRQAVKVNNEDSSSDLVDRLKTSSVAQMNTDSTEVIVEKGDYKIKIKCSKTNKEMGNSDLNNQKSRERVSDFIESSHKFSKAVKSFKNNVTGTKTSKRKGCSKSQCRKVRTKFNRSKLKKSDSKVHVLYEQSNEVVTFSPKPKVSISPERLHQLRQQLQMTREARARGKGKITEINDSITSKKPKLGIQKRLEDVFRDKNDILNSCEKHDSGLDLSEGTTDCVSNNLSWLSNTDDMTILPSSTVENNDMVSSQTHADHTQSNVIETSDNDDNTCESDKLIIEVMELAEGRTPSDDQSSKKTMSKLECYSHKNDNTIEIENEYNINNVDELCRSKDSDDIISEIMDLCVGSGSSDQNSEIVKCMQVDSPAQTFHYQNDNLPKQIDSCDIEKCHISQQFTTDTVNYRKKSKTFNSYKIGHQCDKQITAGVHGHSKPLVQSEKYQAPLISVKPPRTGKDRELKKQCKPNKNMTQEGKVNTFMTENLNTLQGSTGAQETHSHTPGLSDGLVNYDFENLLNKEILETQGFKVCNMTYNEADESHSLSVEYTATPLDFVLDEDSENILKSHGFKIPSMFGETVNDDSDELKNQPCTTVRSDVCEEYLLDGNTNHSTVSSCPDILNSVVKNDVNLSDALSPLLKHEKTVDNVISEYHPGINKDQKSIDEPDSGKAYQTLEESSLSSFKSNEQESVDTCRQCNDRTLIDNRQYGDAASDSVLALPINYPVAELFKEKVKESVTEEGKSTKSLKNSCKRDTSKKSGSILRCSICGKWFKKHSELDKHIISEHVEKKKPNESTKQLTEDTKGAPTAACQMLPSQQAANLSDLNENMQKDMYVNISQGSPIHDIVNLPDIPECSEVDKPVISSLSSQTWDNPKYPNIDKQQECVLPHQVTKFPGVTEDHAGNQMSASKDSVEFCTMSLYGETVNLTGVSQLNTQKDVPSCDSNMVQVYEKVAEVPENMCANNTQVTSNSEFNEKRVQQDSHLSPSMSKTKFSEIKKLLLSPNKYASQNYENVNRNLEDNFMDIQHTTGIHVEDCTQNQTVNRATFHQTVAEHEPLVKIHQGSEHTTINQVVTKTRHLEKQCATDNASVVNHTMECYLNKVMICPICSSEMSRNDFLQHKLVCFLNLHQNVEKSKTVTIQSDVKPDETCSSPPPEYDTSGVSHGSMLSESDTCSDTSQVSGSDLKVVLTKVKNDNLVINGTSLKFCGSTEKPLWKVKDRKKHKIREKSSSLSNMEIVREEPLLESHNSVNMSNESPSDASEMSKRLIVDSTHDQDETCTDNTNNEDGVQMPTKSTDLDGKVPQSSVEVLDELQDLKKTSSSEKSSEGAEVDKSIHSNRNKSQVHEKKQSVCYDAITDNRREKQKTKKKVSLKKSPVNSQENNITDFEKDLLSVGKSKLKEKDKPRKRNKSDKSNKETSPKKSVSKVVVDKTENYIRTEAVNNVKVLDHPQKHFMMSKTAQNIVKKQQEKRNQDHDDLLGFPKATVNLEEIPLLTVGQTFDEINNNAGLFKNDKDKSDCVDLKSAGHEKELSNHLKKSLESLGIVQKTNSKWTDSSDKPFENVMGNQSQKRTYGSIDTNSTLSSYKIPKFDFNSTKSRSQGPFTALTNNSSWVSSFSNEERHGFSFSSGGSSIADTTIKPGTHFSDASPVYGDNLTQTTSVANTYGGVGFYRENISLSFTNASDPWESFIQTQRQDKYSQNLSGQTQIRESPISSTPLNIHKKSEESGDMTELEISHISSIHGKTEAPVKRIRLKRYPTDEMDSRIVVRADANSPRKVEVVETHASKEKIDSIRANKIHVDDSQKTFHNMFGQGDFLMDQQSSGEEVQDWHLLDEIADDADNGNYTAQLNLGFKQNGEQKNTSGLNDNLNETVGINMGNFVEQSEKHDDTIVEKISDNEISDRNSDISDIPDVSDQESEIGDTITDNEGNFTAEDRLIPDVDSQNNQDNNVREQERGMDLDQESDKDLDYLQQSEKDLSQESEKGIERESKIEKVNLGEKEQKIEEECRSGNEDNAIDSEADNDEMSRSDSESLDGDNSVDESNSVYKNNDRTEEIEKGGQDDGEEMEDVLYLSDPDMDEFMNEILDDEEHSNPESKESTPDIKTVEVVREEDQRISPHVISRQSSCNDVALNKDADTPPLFAGSRRPRWMPKGYCFNFFNGRPCAKSKCNFYHNAPSSNIIAKCFRDHLDRQDDDICLDILRSHPGIQEISKQQIDILYRRVRNNLKCFWLLKFMKDREMPLQMVLDNYVRSFARSAHSDYLYNVFEMAKELNIQLQKDAVCHLLEVFSTQDVLLEKLISIMVYSTEDENFVIPQKFVKTAINRSAKLPKLANQLLTWLVGNTQQLQQLSPDKDLMSKFSDMLKKSDVDKDIIDNLEATLTVLSTNPGPSQSGDAAGTDQGLEESLGWTREDEQFWKDNVQSVKFSKDFLHLAGLFVEKRKKGVQFTEEERILYTTVIYHDKLSVNCSLNQFLEGVKKSLTDMKGSEEEINQQVLQIVFGAFDKFYVDKDARMCLAVLDEMRSHSIYPSSIHMFLLKSMDVYLHDYQTMFALEILKGANLDEMDFTIQFKLLGLLENLARQLGNQNLLLDCLYVVRMGFKLIYSDLPDICYRLISEFLKQHALDHAITVFELVQRFGPLFPFNPQIHFQLMMCLCETDHKYIAEAAYKKLCQRDEYPQQLYGTPRKITIPCITDPITAEVILIVEDYLMTLYNELCEMVMSTRILDTTELNLKVFVLQKKGMSQSSKKMLLEIKTILETKLSPPLLAQMSYDCLIINANSLENYLKDLDKKGRCQGLKFVPRINQRPAHRGRGRGFGKNRRIQR